MAMAADLQAASWFDHSRDLMALINEKQNEMPHPLVGIGHSIGGMQLYLSLYCHLEC